MVTTTPFGVPVDPEVKMIHASSSGVGSASSAASGRSAASARVSAPVGCCSAGAALRITRSFVTIAATPASAKTIGRVRRGRHGPTGT